MPPPDQRADEPKPTDRKVAYGVAKQATENAEINVIKTLTQTNGPQMNIHALILALILRFRTPKWCTRLYLLSNCPHIIRPFLASPQSNVPRNPTAGDPWPSSPKVRLPVEEEEEQGREGLPHPLNGLNRAAEVA